MSAAQPAQNVTNAQYKTDLMTPYQKLRLWSGLPRFKAIVHISTITLGIIAPLSFLFFLPMSLWMAFGRHKMDFPARMPRELGKIDKTDPKAGGKGFSRARGEVYLGNHRGTGKEAWASWNDVLTHMYMLAATGGGKSEAIWAIWLNFMASGSSFSLVDGKGTLEMIQHGRIMARRFGVEDDYFVINYQAASKEFAYKGMSNRMNPYSQGTAAQLKEGLASIALSGDAGQNQFFQDNAAQILERIFPALVEKRDKGLLVLDIQSISTYFPLKKMYELSVDPDVSPQNQGYVKGYLDTLGFNWETPNKQPEDVQKMHSQFISHFGKTFSSLSIQYRDIYVVDQGEVNMKDITSNRRTLISSLPSLEKSGGELKNLGNVLLTAQKNAISTDLGDVLEGTAEETTGRLPKHYKVPYGLGFDEWSFYAIQDMALLPAQIRGLRYAGLYAAQDYAGTERAGEMDAEQIFDNTRLKFFGALEDAGKSWQRIRDLISEVKTAVNSNYKYIPGILGGRQVIDRSKAEITHRAEVEIKELQEQVEGQFYMFMRGRLRPIAFFHTDLEGQGRAAAKGNAFKLIRLTKVYAPTDREMAEIESRERFLETIYSSATLFTDIGIIKDIKRGLESRSEDHPLETRDYIATLEEFVERNAMRLGVDLIPPSSRRTPQKVTETESAPPSPKELEESKGEDDDLLDAFATDDTVNTAVSEDQAKTEPPIAKVEPVPPKEEPTEKAEMTEPVPEPVNLAREAEQEAQDPLLEETLATKHAVERGEYPVSGATIFSDSQSKEIQRDIITIIQLLGLQGEEAERLSRETVDKVGRHCYYLAPPRPHVLGRENVDELKARVDDLLS